MERTRRNFPKERIMSRKLSTLVAALAMLALAQAQAQEQPAARQQDRTAAAANRAEQQGRVTRLRDLIGMEVVLENGDSFGIVDDLMVNRSGQIEYALVETEEESKELYPLPWKTLAWYRGQEAEDQYLIIGMNKERVEKAPTVVRTQWPTMTYTQWNTFVPQVTTFYGPVRPVEARAIRKAARTARRVLD